jgi:hypothetical protein
VTGKRWWLLTAGVILWIMARLQWGLGLHWDEIEFFRATRWIGEGKLPYRDFWEHHTPLQWFVFAPVARWLGDGCGVEAVLPMRWAQLSLWAGIIALLIWWIRLVDGSSAPAFTVLLLFGTSTTLAAPAIEYRVDILANLCLLAALTLIVRNKLWMISGVLLALAVLANIRLAPLVVIATLVLLFARMPERRWGWNPRASLLIAGGAVTTAGFAIYVRATKSDGGVADGLIQYNLVSDRLATDMTRNSFWAVVLEPLRKGDVAAVLLFLAMIAGIVLALRGIRRPGPAQLLAIVALISLALQQRLAVHYPYHLHTFYLLTLPLAVLGGAEVLRLSGEARASVVARWAALIVGAALVVDVSRAVPDFGERLVYQNQVMCAASALTAPDAVIFDGVGYALERTPAYKYWFLPAGVQLMAQRGLVEPYDLPQLLANPPGAIVYTHRVLYWFLRFPRLGEYVTRHYIPIYRDLWTPGLSGLAGGRQTSRWLVPAAGRYRIFADERLAKHPWFSSPLQYGAYASPNAPDLTVPLERLASGANLAWTVDGDSITPTEGALTLNKGNVISVTSDSPRTVALLLIREPVSEVFVAPSGQFAF